MNGFRKTVCLAAMVALAVPSLQLRAADPLEEIRRLKVQQEAGIILLEQVQIELGLGGEIQLRGFAVPASLNPSQNVVEDLIPMIGGGFASDQPIDGPLTPLVKSLHADSYAERVHASHVLMKLPPDSLPDVVAALAKESDLEAITRLKVIAGHLFLKPRTNVKGAGGFLGIGGTGPYVSMLGMKFDDPEKSHVPGQAGESVMVRVNELQPGFPAAQELQAGDRIITIAGNGFPDEMAPEELPADPFAEDLFGVSSLNRERKNAAKQMFQTRIRELWPGSIVPFTVLRDGKVIEVSVQLAAMPANNRDALSALVEIRNQLMTTYVESLKTGEKQDVRGVTADDRQSGIMPTFVKASAGDVEH